MTAQIIDLMRYLKAKVRPVYTYTCKMCGRPATWHSERSFCDKCVPLPKGDKHGNDR